MKRIQKIKKIIPHVLVTFVVICVTFLLYSSNLLSRTFEIDNNSSNSSGNKPDFNESRLEDADKKEEVIKYVDTPDQVKAIYMTACVASTTNFRQDLVDLIEQTEINSIIIDIKDYSGTISFDSGLEGDKGGGCRASDMKEFIAELHDKGIYVMGRLTVFQDIFYTKKYPELAVKKASDGSVWSDHKDINFIDVSAKDFWEYILDLTKISHQIGFDEINFDYIRFPSDGNMKDIYFPFSNEIIEENPGNGKVIALENFFEWLYEEIEEYNKDVENPLVTSADLFGMVTTASNDLNIGQTLEVALPYFDFIAPMVYPSHYPPHFNGWADPNKVPYELIHHVMSVGVEKVEAFKNDESVPAEIRDRVHIQQLRPWLQDFDYGDDYGPAEVRAQIDATYDSGLNSWMLWAPSNRYTQAALKSE